MERQRRCDKRITGHEKFVKKSKLKHHFTITERKQVVTMDVFSHAATPARWHHWLFGQATFHENEEYQEFRYKFLIILMISAGLLTLLFILGTLSQINPLGWRHGWAMMTFTATTLVMWLLLRGRPQRFKAIAWSYEVLSLLESTSALIHVPVDELRVLWFYTNVPCVFILLGQKPGWLITLGTMAGLVWVNADPTPAS